MVPTFGAGLAHLLEDRVGTPPPEYGPRGEFVSRTRTIGRPRGGGIQAQPSCTAGPEASSRRCGAEQRRHRQQRSHRGTFPTLEAHSCFLLTPSVRVGGRAEKDTFPPWNRVALPGPPRPVTGAPGRGDEEGWWRRDVRGDTLRLAAPRARAGATGQPTPRQMRTRLPSHPCASSSHSGTSPTACGCPTRATAGRPTRSTRRSGRPGIPANSPATSAAPSSSSGTAAAPGLRTS